MADGNMSGRACLSGCGLAPVGAGARSARSGDRVSRSLVSLLVLLTLSGWWPLLLPLFALARSLLGGEA